MLQQRSGTLSWILTLVNGALAIRLCGCGQTAESTAKVAGARTVTFSRDVAPIVFAKCSTCHHPGEAAPFSLLTYDDVRRRARQIVEVTQSRFMPPWLPTQGHGEFVGERRLTDGELSTIKEWVEAGAPRGDESQLPAAPVFAEGWQLGPPDLSLESPAYTLASDDRDVFRNFVVPIDLEAPRWIESIELRPENPRVTHHARLGVDSSNESIRRDAEDGEPGYDGMAWAQDPDGQLVIWAPGVVASPGKSGVAWRLHPNSSLVLHTHLQPSGKPEVVTFHIGVHFADNPPEQYPVLLRIGTCNIDIPAGAARHVVTGEYVLPIDVDVHTIFPHAHSLCRELSVVAVLPDGSRLPLISIEEFDENWHDCYRYRQPVQLPRGTRLVSAFAYDNTKENPRNGNRPPRRVVYGSNAEDEMADVYLQVTAAHADQRAVLMEHYKRYEMQSQIVGFRKSLEMYPDNPWIQEGLASYLFGVGNVDEAIQILDHRINTGPAAVFPMVGLGMALVAKNELVRAETRFRQAIVMDGEYPLAWLGLGKALAAQKKTKPAEDAYQRALDLAPGLSEARLSLADLLMRRGQLDDAIALCTSAIDDSPEAAHIYLKLAEISAKQNRFDESLEYCSKAQRLAPYTHPPKVLLAVNCFQNGDTEKARALLNEARVESPDHPMPALMLGQLARRKRQLEAARNYFATAASQPIPENWPESHRHHFLVSLHSERFQLAQQLQDINLARDALAEWLKCDPENDQLKTMYNQIRATPVP